MCRRTRRGLRPDPSAGLSGAPYSHTALNRHRFVLTNHHIVLDGWSPPILLQEIFAGYSRAAAAQDGPRIASS